MSAIAENLVAAMSNTNPENKISVIVTAKDAIPAGFNLKSFQGLTGLYHGKLNHHEIKKLAQLPHVQSVELDAENTVQ